MKVSKAPATPVQQVKALRLHETHHEGANTIYAQEALSGSNIAAKSLTLIGPTVAHKAYNGQHSTATANTRSSRSLQVIA